MITSVDVSRALDELSEVQKMHYKMLKALDNFYSDETLTRRDKNAIYRTIVNDLTTVKVNRVLIRAIDCLEKCKDELEQREWDRM